MSMKLLNEIDDLKDAMNGRDIENDRLRQRIAELEATPKCGRCGKREIAEIHTCTPTKWAREIEQQLAAAQETVTRLEKVSIFKEECRQSIEQQLADSQKREVMLRDALRFYKSALTADDVAGVALAATADFSKYVLCHAEPACHVADLASNVRGRFIEYGVSALTPLYRAWEPK